MARCWHPPATAPSRMRDPTAHAELLAIRAACAKLGSERLSDCDLYVTLEPCAMCAAAISFARIRRLYFGAADAKGGAVEHGPRFFTQATCHHAPEVVGGLDETKAGALLKQFFATAPLSLTAGINPRASVPSPGAARRKGPEATRYSGDIGSAGSPGSRYCPGA